jgi:hypothetical protein
LARIEVAFGANRFRQEQLLALHFALGQFNRRLSIRELGFCRSDFGAAAAEREVLQSGRVPIQRRGGRAPQRERCLRDRA